MKNLRVLLLIFTVTLLSWSCGEDEEDPKPLAQAIGTYDYKIKIHFLDGTQLVYLGSDFDDTGTAIVNETSEGFEVKEGGEVQFKGSKIAAASNGFTFDIESQIIDVDGTDVTVTGYDGVTLGSINYNGLYESSSKKLTGYLQFEGILTDENGDEFEVTFVLEFVGTKV